jgi:protein SCO1/2
VPDVTLVDQDAARVALPSLLAADGGVALTFVFTTCGTICPVLTSTVGRMRRELGPRADGLRLVFISIDPDHDTPAALKDFARRFDAGPESRFLTGGDTEVVRVQKAFDAFGGPKTNHQPLTFIRAGARAEWVRIQGFATAAELAGEYRRLQAE